MAKARVEGLVSHVQVVRQGILYTRKTRNEVMEFGRMFGHLMS